MVRDRFCKPASKDIVGSIPSCGSFSKFNKMQYEWHTIHGFMQGWGMQEHIPDNEIVLEDHNEEGHIPWKVVRFKQTEKVIWLQDAHHYLRVTSEDFFSFSSEQLYDLYNRLQPLLEAELERRRKLPPPVFDKITIPKINRIYPQLLL